MALTGHSLSPAEHAAVLAAERVGAPFLVYRDGSGDLRLAPLDPVARVRIGRTDDNDVVLDTDPEVSRAHAQLERVGGGWTLIDDGISRNGSFVNEEKVLRHRRLADGDVLRLGKTAILFRAPGGQASVSTVAAGSAAAARVTEAELRVLVALCAPLLGAGLAPASNREIAESLHLAVASVKTHIRSLFTKLGVDDLPQNRKRAELARRALDMGLVTVRELQR